MYMYVHTYCTHMYTQYVLEYVHTYKTSMYCTPTCTRVCMYSMYCLYAALPIYYIIEKRSTVRHRRSEAQGGRGPPIVPYTIRFEAGTGGRREVGTGQLFFLHYILCI